MKLPLLIAFLSISITLFAQQPFKLTVYFQNNNAVLLHNYTARLDSIAGKFPEEQIKKVTITGHTDNIGTKESNILLSKKRAEIVKDYMKKIFHLNDSVFEVLYYDYEQPVTDNSTEEGRMYNRRTEISISYYPKANKGTSLLELKTYYEDVQEQLFSFSLNDTIELKGKEGTIIVLYPGSLLNNNGEMLKSNLLLRLKEYLNVPDMLLAGLHTNSENGLLSTGGMIKILFLQNGDTLKVNPNIPLQIKIPVNRSPQTGMQVFYPSNTPDSSSLWNASGNSFKIDSMKWRTPMLLVPWQRELEFAYSDINYETLLINTKYSSEYYHRFFEKQFLFLRTNTSFTNQVKYTIHKKHPDSVLVTINARFRHKGRKLTNKKYFDTSFVIVKKTGYYITFTNLIKWINCDKFINEPNLTDYYVKCNNASGPNVNLYFPELRAMMPGYYEKDRYVFRRIPANKKVVIVAYGTNGSQFYFDKKESRTDAKRTEEITLKELSKEEMMKALLLFK